MKRITDENAKFCFSDSSKLPYYESIYERLLEIENVLCDGENDKEYNLDRLSVIINQRISLREEVAKRFKLTGHIPIHELEKILKLYNKKCKNCANWHEEDSCGFNRLGNFVCACSEWSDIENGMTRYTKPDDFCSYFEKKDWK